jgi:hypothetical protein
MLMLLGRCTELPRTNTFTNAHSELFRNVTLINPINPITDCRVSLRTHAELPRYPASKPISMVLDWVLGHEIGSVFNRKHLVHLLRVTDEWNDLDADEVQIVTGALTFSDKTVEQIMTPIDNVCVFHFSFLFV